MTVTSAVPQIGRNWWLFLIVGVVSILAGILAIVYPDITLLALGLFVGIGLLFAGALEIAEAIGGSHESRALSAIVGVLSIIAGVICLRRPGESLLALIVVLGVYLIVAGVVRFIRSFSELEGRAAQMGLGIIDAILGILILSLPGLSLVTLAVLFGLSLLVRGAFMVWVALKLRGARHRVRPRSGGARLMAAAKTPKKLADLSGDELQKLLSLAGGADSVELKLTVPEDQHAATVRALGIDPLDAQIRLVHFFDTPDLALNRAGVVVRARRVQGRGDDSVIKLRPVVPDEVPEHLRRSPGMVVELDAMPGGYVCSASMKGRLGTNDVKRYLSGDRSLRKLFSKEQRAFYAAHAPEGLELEALTLLGPIFVLKANETPAGFGRKLVAEMWFYPDGSRILELSTKCPPPEMFQVGIEARAFLSGQGVDLAGEQHTKTKAALEYFTSRLSA